MRGAAVEALHDPDTAYVSRYALGRDYHKVLRNALQGLADDMVGRIGPMGYRVFVDTGPVLEKALARNAGIGWIGKHTNLIARTPARTSSSAKSSPTCRCPWTNRRPRIAEPARPAFPRAPPAPSPRPTGSMRAAAFPISPSSCTARFPVELRRLIGKRIYGCDDCQLVCPWNKFARAAAHPDFKTRHGLDAARLTELFAWTEQEFLARTEGSAIRRIGYERWLRNIAVALGNAPATDETSPRLKRVRDDPSALVREHVDVGAGRTGAASGGRQRQASNCRLSISRALPMRAAASTTNCRVSGCAGASVRASRTLK